LKEAANGGGGDGWFDIETSAEIGLVAGAKIKILGIGGETKLGVSKQLVKGSLSSGVEYGGPWQLSAAIGAGPASINAHIGTDKISVGGNFFIYEPEISSTTFTEKITLLDLHSYFGIGGSLKVYMNIERTLRRSSSVELFPRVKVDNTFVAPTYIDLNY
jgi:hypothetical protein